MQFKNEGQLQAACVKWYRNEMQNCNGILLAFQNNSENKIRGSVRKALGVLEGASDLLFFYNGEMYFIEMKYGDDWVQRKAQKRFEKKVFANKGIYMICDDFDHFIHIIKTITDD